jgi:hypothetical protein
MSIFLILALAVAMVGTAYVLVRGVIAMATGGGTMAGAQQQQDWMRKRVQYQAVAIVIVALILGLASGSSS